MKIVDVKDAKNPNEHYVSVSSPWPEHAQTARNFVEDANRLESVNRIRTYAPALDTLSANLAALFARDEDTSSKGSELMTLSHAFRFASMLTAQPSGAGSALIVDRTEADVLLGEAVVYALTVARIRGVSVADLVAEVAYRRITGRQPAREPPEVVAVTTTPAKSVNSAGKKSTRWNKTGKPR